MFMVEHFDMADTALKAKKDEEIKTWGELVLQVPARHPRYVACHVTYDAGQDSETERHHDG